MAEIQAMRLKMRHGFSELRAEMQQVEKRMLQHYHHALFIVGPVFIALLTPLCRGIWKWMTQ
jgi:hypothetical protein